MSPLDYFCTFLNYFFIEMISENESWINLIAYFIESRENFVYQSCLPHGGQPNLLKEFYFFMFFFKGGSA